MCLIERKTYVHSNRTETVESTKLCNRAVGSSPCNRLEYKNIGSINVVEAKPPKSSSPSNRRILTEGFNGRRRSGIDVSARSSNSSFRPSTIMTDQSPQLSSASPPSSASSPSYVEIKPKVPTPPTAGTGSPPLERLRSPYPPTLPQSPPLVSPASPPDPRRKVGPDGTAIYERPPPLDIPRANNNERPRRSALARDDSGSSTKAQVDERDDADSSRRYGKRPSTVDTSRRPTYSDSPSRDSDREDKRHDSKLSDRDRVPGGDGSRYAEDDRRRREDDEDRRQADLERDRLAGSARRRQSTRQDDSRERHRQDAASKLEGQRDRSIEENLAAEDVQMARERERASARRRDSQLSQQYFNEQPRWDDEFYDTGRTSPVVRRRSRRITNEAPPSPSSNRSSARRSVALHYEPPTRRYSAISERGQDVIAREQDRARDASWNLNTVLGDGDRAAEEPRYEDEYERDGEAYIGEGQDGARRRRRHRRRHE